MRIFRSFRVASAVCLAWGVVSILGCAPDETSFGRQSTVLLEGDEGRWDGAGGGEGARHEAPLDDAREPAPPLLAAFDDEARVVLVDPVADEVVARRDLGHDVEADPTDLVVDPYRDRLVVVVMPPPYEESQILEIAIEEEGRLGDARSLGWVPGEARVMPLPEGIVVASNADGPRVRLMREDGERTLGRPLPEPLTWRLDPEAERIEGLGAGPGAELVTFALAVGTDGSVAVRDEALLGLVSEEARLVPGRTVQTASDVRTSSDEIVVHDDLSGEIARVDVDGGSALVLTHRARGLAGACGWRDALVVTTTHPDALVVRTLGEERTFELPEGIRSGSPFGRHDLEVIDDRLFAATREGVVAFVRRDGDEPMATRDATFHGKRLRGPLARVGP
jgi:hypothetical protein